MSPNCSHNFAKLILKFSRARNPLHNLVIPPSDTSVAYRTARFLHRHTALSDGEWMLVLAEVPKKPC